MKEQGDEVVINIKGWERGKEWWKGLMRNHKIFLCAFKIEQEEKNGKEPIFFFKSLHSHVTLICKFQYFSLFIYLSTF